MKQTTNTIRKFIMTLIVLVMTAAEAWAQHSPVYNVEVCYGRMYGIYVKGWAYDPDNPQEGINATIRVFYTQSKSAHANFGCMRKRDDVNSQQGITGKHGFEELITYEYQGIFRVEIEFIDVTGDENTKYTTTLTIGPKGLPPFTGSRLELTFESLDYRICNDCVITGIGGGETCIVIEDGVTVTLAGVDNTGVSWTGAHFWAGLTCLGNATIVLAGGTQNRVCGGSSGCPGIQPGPKGTTLTIRGYGSLEATSHGDAAGIGSGWHINCGNIVIESGNIIANNNKKHILGPGAGIGAGCYGSCGDIFITGGTVNAMSNEAAGIGSCEDGVCGNIYIMGGTVNATGSKYGAGIGSDAKGTCGNIFISGSLTNVTAKKGSNAPYSIGPGNSSDDAPSVCGAVAIGGVVTDPVAQSPYTYAPTDATFTVSFDKNYASATGTMASQPFTTNTPQPLTACAFTRPYYDFKEWNTRADGSGYAYTDEQTVNNLGNVMLYAQWAPISYNIAYILDEGTNADSNPTTYTIESDAFTLSTPTRLGFLFAGWTWEGHDTPTKNPTIATGSYGDKTFTAHWTLDPIVTLTADMGHVKLYDGHILKGTGGANTHITIADGATVTLSGVTITDITYDLYHKYPAIICQGNATIILDKGTVNTLKGGYYSAAIQAGLPGTTLTIQGSGTLNATGGSYDFSGDGSAAIGSDYSNDYNSNGRCGNIIISGGTVNATGGCHCPAIDTGNGEGCGNITITDGVTSVTATAGRKSSYSIGRSSKYGCGTVIIGGTVTGPIVQSPVTYNPSNTATYTVSFSKNADEAEGTMGNQQFTGNQPQALAACTFAREGYFFDGWNTKADGSGTPYGDNWTILAPSNMTLYAQWREPKQFMVTFNANGGTGNMENQPFEEGKSQNLNACTFTRDGYIFTGWNTEDDGRGTSFTDGQTVSDPRNLTLYAQWQISPYSITYNLDGGVNASSNPATYTVESDAITIAEPTRVGFIFDGWTYDGQDEPTKDVTIAHGSYGDRSFTAHWTFNPIATITPETGNARLYDGHTLTGTGGADTHITIADGATVTLSGVTITDIFFDNEWAGISCEGNATIILADGTTNTVKAGSSSFPGITVPEGKTLTIQGSGTLIADSKGSGAGIGAGYRDCGNIVIEGGTIIATGGDGSAGIGSGKYFSCGNITITDGVTSVTAKAGWNAPYCIGAGSRSTVGTVTIGGVVTGSIMQSPFTYNPSDTTPYTVTFDANGGEGSMDEQEFTSNTLQALNANTFTRKDYDFIGWNTATDGKGASFTDRQSVFNLGNVTLYAQWKPTYITLNSSSGNFELMDGNVLSGTGGRDTHITIADGATVTLYNVNITQIVNLSNHSWAGITCLGDATIIVKGTNAVKGGLNSAGIFVPSGKTLTITGDGSLTATGNNNGCAGIGGNKETNCGNIIIDGGTITTVGYLYAAGIGGGYNASCGNITITEGVTRVSATTNLHLGQVIIGNGLLGSCGTITIAPELIDVTSGSTRTLTAPATAPTITTQSSDLELTAGYDGGHGLSVEATAATMHTLSYQWYANTTNSTENGTPIDGATDPVYVIPTGKAVGTTEYYYCVVTATRLDYGQTATATSDVVTVTVSCPEWAGSGTEGDPYVITTAEQLDLLAGRVNGCEGSYTSAWYELGADLSYTHGNGFDEHNFDGIGLYDDAAGVHQPFNGHFDGKGHTVSGIRLYKGDEEEEDDDGNLIQVNSYKGLFGWIGHGGTVTGITLRDARITGHTVVGGIVGLNSGTVSDCYVGSDVVIHALAEDASDHGGIVGYNMGTVKDCVSAATVSIDDGSAFHYTSGPAGCKNYGGIVGYNDSYEGTLSGNLAIGATVSAAANDTYGAIAGYNGGTLSQNFYSGCTVAGVADAGNVGQGWHYDEAAGSYIISDVDGAWKLARGDVNRDRQVTVTDAAIVTGYVKTHTAPDGFVEAIADMDGDSQATEADVVEILKKILE